MAVVRGTERRDLIGYVYSWKSQSIADAGGINYKMAFTCVICMFVGICKIFIL